MLCDETGRVRGVALPIVMDCSLVRANRAGRRLRRTVSMHARHSAASSARLSEFSARAYDSPGTMEFFRGIRETTAAASREGKGCSSSLSFRRRRQMYEDSRCVSSWRSLDLSHQDVGGALVPMEDTSCSGLKDDAVPALSSPRLFGELRSSQKKWSWEGRDIQTTCSLNELLARKARRKRRLGNRSKSSVAKKVIKQLEEAKEWREWLDADE